MTNPAVPDDEGTFTCTTCGRTGWWSVASTRDAESGAALPELEFSLSHSGEDLSVLVDATDIEDVWRRLFAQLQDLTGCSGGSGLPA